MNKWVKFPDTARKTKVKHAKKTTKPKHSTATGINNPSAKNKTPDTSVSGAMCSCWKETMFDSGHEPGINFNFNWK